MKNINNFRILLDDGRKADFWQNENGLYQAEIRDKFEMIEHATICETPAEAQKFIEDRR